jgi:DedD protein
MATRPAAPARKRAGSAEDGVADPALPQKKRARHRLIGAIALCLLAAIVVPLLLEREPSRPAADVSIVMPSRDTPLPPRAAVGDAKPADAKAPDAKAPDAKAPDAKAPDAKAADAKAADAKAADAKAGDPKSGDARPSGATVARGTIEPAPAADAPARDAKAPPKADPRSAAKAGEPRKDEIGTLADAAQAKARGEAAGRYLLQVGAFAGEAGAKAAVERVQATGLRAFTEKVKTERGERVRVRVGPFPSREAAEQARGALKSAGIEAAVIAP